jgi:hypothetical protein
MKGIISAWGKILTGYQPNLSIEITRECPLACPGCFAYGGDHLGGDVTLRELRDLKALSSSPPCLRCSTRPVPAASASAIAVRRPPSKTASPCFNQRRYSNVNRRLPNTFAPDLQDP